MLMDISATLSTPEEHAKILYDLKMVDSALIVGNRRWNAWCKNINDAVDMIHENSNANKLNIDEDAKYDHAMFRIHYMQNVELTKLRNWYIYIYTCIYIVCRRDSQLDFDHSILIWSKLTWFHVSNTSRIHNFLRSIWHFAIAIAQIIKTLHASPLQVVFKVYPFNSSYSVPYSWRCTFDFLFPVNSRTKWFASWTLLLSCCNHERVLLHSGCSNICSFM